MTVKTGLRAGYLLDKRPSQQFGIMYDALIMAIRAEIPKPAEPCGG